MLTFHRANFRNFVLLRDVEIHFSEDEARPVTVIHAENGSGKTTCLRALEWTLYGGRALPASQDYRIQPPEWTPSDGPIEVACELEFSVLTPSSRARGRRKATKERYILRRRAIVSGDSVANPRRDTDVVLLRKTARGVDPEVVKSPQSLIDGWLPASLREIFFTDGDKAFAYISADEQSARRQRVERAVKALLHLDLVESTANRLRGTTRPALRKHEAAVSSSTDLQDLAEELEQLEHRIESQRTEYDQCIGELEDVDQRQAELQEQRDAALKRGDERELQAELRRAEEERARYEDQLTGARKELSELLQDPNLEAAVLGSRLEIVRKLLKPLHESGRIPASYVPFLRERVKAGTCVCGADLVEHRTARTKLVRLLEDSEQEQGTANRLSELYVEVGEAIRRTGTLAGHWPTRVRKVMARADQSEDCMEEWHRKVHDLNNRITSLPKTDIQRPTKKLSMEREAGNELRERIAVLGDGFTKDKKKLQGAEKKYRVAQGAVKKGRSARMATIVTGDILDVLEATLVSLRHKKLRDVSREMDRLFRDMVRADPDGGIIRGTELTTDYDVVVHGP